MTRRQCAAKNCRNSSNNKNLHFFRFPKEPERLELWIKYCERDDVTSDETNYCYYNFRLCSAHFENQMFSNIQRNKLLAMAIPTIVNPLPSLKRMNIDTPNESDENLENVPCTRKLRSSKLRISHPEFEKQKGPSIDFLSITDANIEHLDVKNELDDLILENNRIQLKDEQESCDSTSSFIKEETIEQENFIILNKSQDSNDSQISNIPRLSCGYNISDNITSVTNQTNIIGDSTLQPQWIILVSTEANKVSSNDTNPTSIMSLDATQNLTLPGLLPNNPSLPAIPTLDPTFMQPIGMPAPLAVIPPQNFANQTLPMDSSLNNLNSQWIIVLNSTGTNTSVTNTLTNTSATLISGQQSNIIQNPLPALPTVPTISSLPQTIPQLPVVPNLLNQNPGSCNPLQPNAPADWIVVISSTAPETEPTQSSTSEEHQKEPIPDSQPQILIPNLKIESQSITSNVKASISFETKSVNSNSMSISCFEHSNQKKSKTSHQNGHLQPKVTISKTKKTILESVKSKISLTNKVSRVQNCGVSKFFKSCKKFLSPEMLELVKVHILQKRKNLKSTKNMSKFKQFALKMHSISPQAYKFCADSLKLPSKKSLQKLS